MSTVLQFSNLCEKCHYVQCNCPSTPESNGVKTETTWNTFINTITSFKQREPTSILEKPYEYIQLIRFNPVQGSPEAPEGSPEAPEGLPEAPEEPEAMDPWVPVPVLKSGGGKMTSGRQLSMERRRYTRRMKKISKSKSILADFNLIDFDAIKAAIMQKEAEEGDSSDTVFDVRWL
jgi:hypothetical protein